MKLRLATIATIFALGILAHADTLTLTFTATGSNLAGGVYAYPYYLSVDGGPAQAMMCLSYDNEITLGESWLVDVLPVTTAPEREAAWLLADAQTNPANDIADNLAAWNLFSGDVPMTLAAEAQFGLAVAGYGSVDAAGYDLYVPVEGFNSLGAPQTFIGGAAPEPCCLALMGLGLAAAGVYNKYRRLKGR
jgi:hypothetical protein